MYNCPIIVKAVVTTFKNLIASYAEVIQDIEKRESEVAKLKKEQPTIVRNP
jgi:cell division protein FtsB